MAALQLNFGRWLSAAGLALLAGAALAEPPANNNGAMTFPNVRVVNAPLPASAAPKAAADQDQGMRAAVDADGNLRPLTAEEAQKLAPSKPTLQLNQRSLQQADAGAQSDSSDQQMLYGPGNTVGAILTDESMVYQVAHKADEGVEVREFTGKTAAERDARKQDQQPQAREEADHGHH